MGITLDVSHRYRKTGKRRRKRGTEPIDMRERRHGYFPQTFIWRGHRYDVQAVERCWTVSRPGWGGRVEQHRFRVRCREGAFEIYQDVRQNTWHIQQ